MLRRILRSTDNPGGGGTGNEQQPAGSPVAPAAPHTPNNPAPPHAAETVIIGTKTERELALEQELEAEKTSRKKDQVRVSELENENRQLKDIPKEKPKKSAGPISSLLGWED